MPKRKAVDLSPTAGSPKKRATRTKGVLSRTPPVANACSPTKRRGRPPGIPAIAMPKFTPSRLSNTKATRVCSPNASSLKENLRLEQDEDDAEEEDGDEDDELNLSPRKGVPSRSVRFASELTEEADVLATPMKSKAPSRNLTMSKRSKFVKEVSQPEAPFPLLAVQNTREVASPSKVALGKRPQVNLPKTLPPYLVRSQFLQQRACIAALHDPPLAPDQEDEINSIALEQLKELLKGTVERGEGNSCLVLGPAGSGKTRVFEHAVSHFEGRAVIIRLSGFVQHSDRLAMREVARQVVEQTGNDKFSGVPDEDENPFLDDADDGEIPSTVFDGHATLALPPASHLPSLIAQLSSLTLPVILLLDGFHLFTCHARQALLYCLLDAVQSCRSGAEGQKGLAVVGLTSRVDVINLLEKRVKSRFSHRILRTAGMASIDEWKSILRRCLTIVPEEQTFDCSSSQSSAQEWKTLWESSVDKFLDNRLTTDALRDLFGLTKDIRLLLKAMIRAVSLTSPSSPFLLPSRLESHISSQRGLSRAAVLSNLNYPLICLLIAAEHVRVSGHDTFTFEQLYYLFRMQVRLSSAAPMAMGSIAIGMINISRSILMGGFEQLAQMGLFVATMAPSIGLGKQFVKHRCTVEREDLRITVERKGQTSLKKWFSKAQ